MTSRDVAESVVDAAVERQPQPFVATLTMAVTPGELVGATGALAEERDLMINVKVVPGQVTISSVRLRSG